MDSALLLAKARNCLELESKAIEATAAALDEAFADVIRDIKTAVLSRNKLIFSGVGKNTAICQKLIGSFNSTGVPACFLDATQALHGDLGLLVEKDLVFLLSNSGESEELLRLLPLIKRLGSRTIVLTAQASSRLAREADRVLTYQVPREACPLGLAPTASTTAALAIGDALAMVYLDSRGFSRDDFARLHPSGSLGKTLLLRVDTIMRTGERFANAPATITVQEALFMITRAQCGAIALTDPDTGCLQGIFTDGDFRRCAVKNDDFIDKPVASFMSRDPIIIPSGSLAVEALKCFEKNDVNDLIVVDTDNRPIGLIDNQDLPKLKIL